MKRGTVRWLLVAAVLCSASLNSPASASAAAPAIGATWVTDVTATSANLRAEINPNGTSTTYRFEYLSDAAYEANLGAIPPRDGFSGAAKAPLGGAAAIGAGSSPVTVVQHLSGLSPVTEYRYRAVASNGDSVTPTLGPLRSFGTEAGTNVFSLLDNRGWEMVSPIDKNGGAIQGFGANFGGDVLQAAADGNSFTYSSADSFGAAPQGAPAASQYLARRSAGGWSSANITTPSLAGGYGDEPVGVPYQLFSSDLARGILLEGNRCAEPGQCPRSYSIRDSGGGALATSPSAPELRFAGASPDLRSVVLSTCAALTEDATEVPGVGGGCNPPDHNLYLWSEGGVELVNGLQNGLAGPFASLPGSNPVSADGSRIYWTQAGSVLFLREGGSNRKIIEGGEFQTATPDGRLAFFIKDEHLYSYDAESEESTYYFLAPGGEGAGFGGLLGLLGVSADGSYIYYVGGDGALYLRHEGTDTKVADAAAASDYPPATATARVSADGSHLLFLSAAQLTDYENNGVTEVYLYGPPAGGGAARLVCVSCNPSGERPKGASSIPGAIANGKGTSATRSYKPRALSADGTRVFFDSADALVNQDSNSRPDVYEWEASGVGTCARQGGCVGLVSSGRSGEASTFVDASASGSDVFFLTDSSLYPLDPGSFDVYDARVGGGFAPPPLPIPCNGDACQALPSPPEDPTPGTLVRNAGNPPPHVSKPKTKKPHKKHRHRHRKGQIKRGGKR